MEELKYARSPGTRSLQATQWATAEEWMTQKTTIEQLYRIENKTLSQVMAIMEEKHGFKAT